MKPYNLIFTKDSKIILSSVQYKDWREIQYAYENYMTSLDFKTLDEIIEYLTIEYKLSIDKSSELVKTMSGLVNSTIELDFF